MFADPLTERLAAFVRDIGLPLRAAALPADTLLPGLDIRDGAIVVDEARLAHPGDILHEAGHLAVADPAERNVPRLAPTPGDEMASIARRSATSAAPRPSCSTPPVKGAVRPRSWRTSKPDSISACRCCSFTR